MSILSCSLIFNIQGHMITIVAMMMLLCNTLTPNVHDLLNAPIAFKP